MNYGTAQGLVYGVKEPKPISNAPAGARVKLRMRPYKFAYAIVYDPATKRARGCAIRDKGDQWELEYDIAMPAHQKPRP